MANPSIPLTQDRLKQLLHYDPETGIFTRLVTTGNLLPGTKVGRNQLNGYTSITIDRKHYYTHRLAWFYVTGSWPKNDIDHINRNRSDNRYANLREATRSLNMRNILKFKNNKSGFKGVSWCAVKNKWRANIKLNGKQTFLGYFDIPEKAHGAYVAAAEKNFGEFARIG